MKRNQANLANQKQKNRSSCLGSDYEEPLLGISSDPTRSWCRFGHIKAAYFEELAIDNQPRG